MRYKTRAGKGPALVAAALAFSWFLLFWNLVAIA